MGSHDHAQATIDGGRDSTTAGLPVVIGVVPALADRVRLAELLDGFGPLGLVLVATIDEARLLLDGAGYGGASHGGHTGASHGGHTGASHGGHTGASNGGHGGASNGVRTSTPNAATYGTVNGSHNGHPVPLTNGRRNGARVKHVAGLHVDSDLLLANRNGHHVGLTPLEHDLLLCLGSEPRQTWTHAALHERVWKTRHAGGQADIHSVVKRLRRKLAALGARASIEAVRGVGFRLEDVPDLEQPT